MTYQVFVVPDQAPTQLEQLGTKGKFWYRGEGGGRLLFKEGRPGTGENWAEKVCAEIAERLRLPHAQYDLAEANGRRGVITPSIVPEGGRLILGNELLARVYEDENYDPMASYRDSQHTLRRVAAVLRNPVVGVPCDWHCPNEIADSIGVFIGYLMLDALVGNQDRHHENWALIYKQDVGLSLAPTFDHASSLGRNETDHSRVERLATKDVGRSVLHYASRARSALFEKPTSKRPMKTIDAFADARKIVPLAGKYWLSRLEAIDPQEFEVILRQVPNDWITLPAIDFAQAMLTINRMRLLELMARE